MKVANILVATTALVATPMSDSQKIDVSAMTCKQFLQADEDTARIIMAWFLGFYSEVENPQVIDLHKMHDAREKFVSFCTQQSAFKMTTAAEGILGN